MDLTLEQIMSRPEPLTYDEIRTLEKTIPTIVPEDQMMDVKQMTHHYFCEGMYARQMSIPAGTFVIGKMHSYENFFLLIAGEMTVQTGKAVFRVKAPFMCVTKPGDKRVGYAHTDCVTINFLPNGDNEQDLDVLESRYTIDEDQL
jgi:quercetin dioxygenase-like cupin family protein